MFFTFSNKKISPITNDSIYLDPKLQKPKIIMTNNNMPIPIGNMFIRSQKTNSCSSCNSYR